MLLTEQDGEKSYGIHEVYYDADGIKGWTVNPTTVCGDTLDGLRLQLDRMLACLSKPILRPVGDDALEEISSGLAPLVTGNSGEFPEADEQWEAAKKTMQRNHNILRKLADD